MYAVPLFRSIGPQPASVVSSSAIGYFSIDLDPSPGQKAKAAQFLQTFPSLKARGDVDVDLRRVAFQQLRIAYESPVAAFDYDRDVAPWLGSQFALVAVPDYPSGVAFGVVLAVRDEALARPFFAQLDKVGKTECEVREQFAVCTERGKLYRFNAGPTPLADKRDFKEDLASVADDWVASLWVDTSALAKAYNDERLFSGRVFGLLKFDDDQTLVWNFKTAALSVQVPYTLEPGTRVTELSSDVVGVWSMNGIPDLLRAAWPQILRAPGGREWIIDTQHRLGVHLPQDLTRVIGQHVTAVMETRERSRIDDIPRLALISDSDPVIAGRIAADVKDWLKLSVSGNRVVFSTDPDMVDGLFTGGLTQSPKFTRVAPRYTEAASVAYFDESALESLWGLQRSVPQANEDDLGVVEAVGFCGNQLGSAGWGQFRLTLRRP